MILETCALLYILVSYNWSLFLLGFNFHVTTLLIARILPSNLSNKYWELSFFSSGVSRNGIHWETLLNFYPPPPFPPSWKQQKNCWSPLPVCENSIWPPHHQKFVGEGHLSCQLGLGGCCKFHSGSKIEPWRGPGSGAAHGSSNNPVASNSKIRLDHDNVNGNSPNKDLMLFFNTSAACIIINRT